MRSVPLLSMLILLGAGLPATAFGHEPPAYKKLRQDIVVEQRKVRSDFRRLRRPGRRQVMAGLSSRLLRRVDQLHAAWLGTRWGLGIPQTLRPGQGKVNCGLFVALVLRHAGFSLNIWKFNRQTAADAIRSVAPKRSRRYFRNALMKKFLARVKAMGPGLFLIGLDFHIGFLRQTDKELRFIHASYIDERVVDEPAATAAPIVSSKYRVVGKILQPNMLKAWMDGKRLKILGKR